jgi:hypothetical protein
MKRKKNRSIFVTIAAAAGAVALAISMKGMLPELVRYIKLERM